VIQDLTADELEALVYAANRVLVADQQWALRRAAAGRRAQLAALSSDALVRARDKATAELERQRNKTCVACGGRGWVHCDWPHPVQACGGCNRYECDDDAQAAHDEQCSPNGQEAPECCGKSMYRSPSGPSDSWQCSRCGGIHVCSDPRLRAGAICPNCAAPEGECRRRR
jgi:hypothetical protein